MFIVISGILGIARKKKVTRHGDKNVTDSSEKKHDHKEHHRKDGYPCLTYRCARSRFQ